MFFFALAFNYADRLTNVTDAANHTTAHAHDTEGNLTSTDAEQQPDGVKL